MEQHEFINESYVIYEFKDFINGLAKFDSDESIPLFWRQLNSFISFMENENVQYPLLLMSYMYMTKHLINKGKLVDRKKWELYAKIIVAATSILHRNKVINIDEEPSFPDQSEAIMSISNALHFIEEFPKDWSNVPGHNVTLYPEMLHVILNAIPKSIIDSDSDFQDSVDRVQALVKMCKDQPLSIRHYLYPSDAGYTEDYNVPKNTIDGYDLLYMAQVLKAKANTFNNPNEKVKMVFVFQHTEAQYKIHYTVSTIVALATQLDEQCAKKRVSLKRRVTVKNPTPRKKYLKKSPKKASYRKNPKQQ